MILPDDRSHLRSGVRATGEAHTPTLGARTDRDLIRLHPHAFELREDRPGDIWRGQPLVSWRPRLVDLRADPVSRPYEWPILKFSRRALAGWPLGCTESLPAPVGQPELSPPVRPANEEQLQWTRC
jgi:hypothetical protein